MTDGQDVRALLKSIGGLKRRVAETFFYLNQDI